MPSAPSLTPSLSLRRFRMLWRRVYHRGWLDLWFPQWPIALAVGFAGSLALLPAINRYLDAYLHLQFAGLMDSLHPLAEDVPKLILRGVPNAVIGVLQIVIAIGLVLRSRLAWITALVMTLAQIVTAIGYDQQAFYTPEVLYVVALFVALTVSGSTFNRSSVAAGTLFAFASTLLLLSYGVLGSLFLGRGFDPPINDLQQAVYFTIVTMSTVGYGDILPKSDDTRLFVVSLIVVGITVFVTSLSALIGPILQGRLSHILEPRRVPKMRRVDHYIIAGTGPLARNTARELVQRGLGLVVITDDETERVDGAEMEVGDATDLDVLRKAGAESARAVLALSEDDAENAFVILALKDLDSTARKVAAVNARKNMDRVRRVQPDMIMAPAVFGGEVLAMALTEEKIDGEKLMERYLDVMGSLQSKN
ncbi:voltage-gated potassium channel protein [Rhodopila sp.]|uniref:voltage-gated potassium channel protein n=1 Tax=Rhodopila sp. TaxID=2480087 RepID=UPI002D7F7585|nr:voltage-gated potassium channel protein [Rhodopila sp.]